MLACKGISLTGDEASGSFSPLMRDFIFDVKVPRPCRHFCGRDAELEKLHELLCSKGKVFVQGIAGIGKSELAKAYIVSSLIFSLGHIPGPVTLFLLAGGSETGMIPISEESAALYGMLALFVIVVAAVAIYVHCGFKNDPYKYLDEEAPFKLEYGVRGMVLERQKSFRHTYVCSNIIATCICVLSPFPLLASGFTYNEFLQITMLAVTMLLAAIGVFLFILNGVQWASMQKLLREGEYSPKGIKRSRVKEAIARIYWITLTAIYLWWSFAKNAWEISWIVFLLGGLLFAAVMALCDIFIDRNRE